MPNHLQSDMPQCYECYPTLTQTSWTLSVGSCNDSNPCTYPDTCSNGDCIGTLSCYSQCGKKTPSKLWVTLVEHCYEGGVCKRNKDACLIQQHCYTSGDANPQVPSQICLPSVDNTYWVGTERVDKVHTMIFSVKIP